MKLSMRIRIARQRARMSQEALALNLGVTRSAVANWESVEGVLPATGRLAKLAELTSVSFEWLATGRGAVEANASANETPAVDVEMVYDELERQMLSAFRRMTRDARVLAILELEANATVGRSTERSPR
ncbi:transcriptional regulator [Pseudoxanthomonas sp. Root630]|uniref:helix-turn-helix domain-containing protein n=1 Tax=Pseudoxanthomonas sp. Root630 TaxID=1736574 RepID=UPI0007030464|nr:transcriptional regulator [Pseudoxanthomonas sp. Root630]KRA41805.1 hypothetical protein ASD72_14520 [Pseudoxanthomonas sp. Root630]